MAEAFTNLSWWLWSGKHQEPSRATMASSSSRRVKRKRRSREEPKIDREYDVVLVPSDGVCVSGSESDDSDWSVGWLEPHGPDFQSDDDDTDNSFAVLVPCYGRGPDDMDDDSEDNILTAVAVAVGIVPDAYSAEGKRYMQEWLSSLQNN